MNTVKNSGCCWYVMRHYEMKRFIEWLKMENARRLKEGEAMVEHFYPYDFLRDGDRSVSNDFIRIAFLKTTEADICNLVNNDRGKGTRICLRHYYDTNGRIAIVPDEMMQQFLQACVDYRGQFEIAPPLSSIEVKDKVRIMSGPFAGNEAMVERVQLTHGTIHLELSVELLSGVMNIRMNGVDKNKVMILNHESADAIRTDFIEYTQNHLLDILAHRIKRIADEDINRSDADMLVRLYRYRHHQIANESARNHFLALMLICAHLCHYKDDELQLREKVLNVLDGMSRKNQAKAATDTRTYLWIALYISTHDPSWRNAAKQYVRDYQPKSVKLRRFVSLIRDGRKV